MSNPLVLKEVVKGDSIGTWSFSLNGFSDISDAAWTGKVRVKKL